MTKNRLHAKKKTYGYRERSEAKRQEFIGALTQRTQEMLVYVDEAGMDNQDDYA